MTSAQNLCILSAESSKRFRCIGSDCESTCCKNWHIEVDKNTYVRYSKVQDKEIRKILNRNLSINQELHSDENYADIQLNEHSLCPMYKDGLCRLQAELGEEYLSNVCFTYPRYTNIIDGVMESSLTVSCPEVARTVMMDRQQMKFGISEAPENHRYILFNKIETQNMSKANPIYSFFSEIRTICITILQSQNYSLPDRLILLGLLISKICQAEQGPDYQSNIGQIIKSFDELIQGSQQNLFQDIPGDYTIQLKLLSEIVKQRLVIEGITNEYQECLVEMLNGLGFSSETDNGAIIERYRNAYTNHFGPYFSQNSIVFENYLVNYAFKNIFPFENNMDIFGNYMMMVMHYALIKLHLIGMAAYHGGIDDKMVVRLVFNLSRTIEHNSIYLEYIRKLLYENKLNSLPYMAILIKN